MLRPLADRNSAIPVLLTSFLSNPLKYKVARVITVNLTQKVSQSTGFDPRQSLERVIRIRGVPVGRQLLRRHTFQLDDIHVRFHLDDIQVRQRKAMIRFGPRSKHVILYYILYNQLLWKSTDCVKSPSGADCVI